MAPFIKFTQKSQGPSGENRQLRFVNAAFISNALYVEESKELLITMHDQPGKEAFKLNGVEAEEALKVLQSL